MSDIDKDQRAFARERLAPEAGTSASLTRAIYEDDANIGTTKYMKAKSAKIMVEGTVNVYLAEGGGTPSSTLGITLVPGQYHWVRGIEGMRNIRMRGVGATADIEVTYYR